MLYFFLICFDIIDYEDVFRCFEHEMAGFVDQIRNLKDGDRTVQDLETDKIERVC